MMPFIKVFGLTIPMYGVSMFVGVVAAMIVVHILKKRVVLSEDDFYSAIIWTIVCGMLGAKLLYLIVEIKHIIADPGFLLNSITSGFVYYGGLIGAFLGFLFFSIHKKQTFLLYSDMFLPCISLGMIFGRIGCFFAGCCYGIITDSPLGICFPALNGTKVLPTQLFESVFCLLLFILLLFIYKKQKRHGLSSSVFCIGYGLWRFIIEFFRGDERGNVGILSTSQFISIFIFLAGLILLILYIKKLTPEIQLAGSAAAKETEELSEETQEDIADEIADASNEENSEDADESPVDETEKEQTKESEN